MSFCSAASGLRSGYLGTSPSLHLIPNIFFHDLRCLLVSLVDLLGFLGA